MRTVPKDLGSVASRAMWHHIALRAREYGTAVVCMALGFGFWVFIWLICKSVNGSMESEKEEENV